jgi:enamine deaminase RidA (YjgF/YER057c/UK114 family)
MSAIKRLHPGTRMSQAVVHSGLLYTAGQVDSQAADVAGQTKNVLAKIDALLTEGESTRSQILSANVWLADMASFGEMNDVWEHWIDPSNPPVRATVESRLAAPEYRVEVSVIAAVSSTGPKDLC